MADQKDVRISIDTGALLGRFLAEIQNLLDIITLVAAGQDSVTDEQYQADPTFMRFFPAVNQRLTLEDAKSRSQQWLMTSFLTDSVNSTGTFLDKCWKVCALYRLSESQQIVGQQLLDIFGKHLERFHKAGFPEKFNTLRDDFGVETPFEGHFLSLNKARNCLVHRRGVVARQDVNENDRLVITRSVVELAATPPGDEKEHVLEGPAEIAAGSTLAVRVRDRRQEFAIGERIVLNSVELYQSIFTLFAFAKELVQSIEAYGERQGVRQRRPNGPENMGSAGLPSPP